MQGQLFTLVNAEDRTQIFAWGMQITHQDDTEAVIYRHDPSTGHTTTGLHTSAEQALARWGKHRPLELVWELNPEDVLQILDNLDQ